jgi:hypothetical protein
MIFKSKIIGKHVIIKVDPGDLEPESVQINGVIKEIVKSVNTSIRIGSGSALIVGLDRPISIENKIEFREIYIIGIGMNLLHELFGKRQRPSGLPILIRIWWLDEATKNRALKVQRPPPSYPDSESRYIGRGEIILG